jgi:hypothetical protein
MANFAPPILLIRSAKPLAMPASYAAAATTEAVQYLDESGCTAEGTQEGGAK